MGDLLAAPVSGRYNQLLKSDPKPEDSFVPARLWPVPIHSLKKAPGIQDGVPIALGYFAVSFAFGLAAVEGGLSAWTAGVISLTNLTSAGQFAGVQLIFAHRPLFEIALTTLLINLRYMLMSLSLSQKIHPRTGILARLVISYGITDEVYAVAISRHGPVRARYMLGLILLPALSWVGGTLAGGLAGQILPDSLRSALGIALYAMFVAIVMPTVRQSRPVAAVVGLAILINTAIALLPSLSSLHGGWQIILATVIAAGTGAWAAPIQTAHPKADAADDPSSGCEGGGAHD
jgi:4-azaleucine resistance transporter AzlC